jgi:uncharacterized protein YkwD
MARDHVEQMKIHQFFGHVHPSDPSRATLGDRAARVGYAAPEGENCSGFGGGESNIWRWRSDSGHHRTMVRPGTTEVGLAVADTAVLNVGRALDQPITWLFEDTAW